MNKKLLMTLMFAFILLAVSIGYCFNTYGEDAYANESTLTVEELCALYTDTQYPNNVDFYEYVGEFSSIKNRYLSTINQGTYFQNNSRYCKITHSTAFEVEIFGDDNITSIIPRELFTTTCDVLYIGRAYGFYIKTVMCDSYLRSYVTLFGININNRAQYDLDFCYQITNLLQLEFMYLDNTTNQNLSLQIDIETTDHIERKLTCYFRNDISTAVIPVVTFRNEDYTYLYQESDKIEITDISFAASLYNYNSLNYGDVGYHVNQDFGYFFTGGRYIFDATLIPLPDTEAGINEILEAAFNFGVGFIPVAAEIWSVLGLIYDIENAIEVMEGTLEYDASNEYCNSFIFSTYNTHFSQVENFGNLIKMVSLIANTQDETPLTFKSGDYAQGVFEVAHRETSDELDIHSHINVAVALKVTYEEGDTKITTLKQSSGNSYALNTQKICPIENIYGNIPYYILPNSDMKFSFTPEYTSNYCFNYNNSLIDISIMGESDTEATTSNSRVLNAGEKYIITLKNTSNLKQHGNMSITCSEIFEDTINILQIQSI